MTQRSRPTCGHADSAFKIITRHYGGGDHYWMQCKLCGKMGTQAIPKLTKDSAAERAEAARKPPGRCLDNSVSAEIRGRRLAGACVKCGLTICPGTRSGNCTARREIVNSPKAWV